LYFTAVRSLVQTIQVPSSIAAAAVAVRRLYDNSKLEKTVVVVSSISKCRTYYKTKRYRNR
jgi:hypothetical protein